MKLAKECYCQPHIWPKNTKEAMVDFFDYGNCACNQCLARLRQARKFAAITRMLATGSKLSLLQPAKDLRHRVGVNAGMAPDIRLSHRLAITR